jgi:putative transposase
LWRSLKHECVHLNAFETGSELRAGPAGRFGYCNGLRPYSALRGQTPDEAYGMFAANIRLAA